MSFNLTWHMSAAKIEFNALAGRGFGLASSEDHHFGKTCWRGWDQARRRFGHETDKPKPRMNMNLNPAELLNPIFNALDSLIENDGVYLTWLCLAGACWPSLGFSAVACGNG